MIDKFMRALPWVALAEAVIFVALFVVDMIFHIHWLVLVAMAPVFALLIVFLFVVCAEDKLTKTEEETK